MTIGLSFLIALMQTVWYRTGNPKYLYMVKFWSKLFLINFGMGVVTGIVQEFQFGMNWSDYSRFVGDMFGAVRQRSSAVPGRALGVVVHRQRHRI